jgi:hypothetical protein
MKQTSNKQDMVDASLYKQWGSVNDTTTVEARAHCTSNVQTLFVETLSALKNNHS